MKVEGLRLRINAYPGPPDGPGGDDIPKLGGGGDGGGRGVSVSIERLVIDDGEFVLNHERVPLDLDLPEFEGRLAGRAEGGVAGHVSFGPGVLQFGDAPELPLGTQIDLVIHRGLLTVLEARIVGEKTNLAYHGRLRLSGRPQGQFTLEGPVDLALLERHIFRSGLGLAGTASWSGLLSVDGSRLRIEGRAQGRDGAFRGMAVPRFATWLSYDGIAGLVIRDLDVEALGGSAFLALDVPPTQTGRPVHVRGPVQEVDGERALGMLFGWGPMGVGTAASGDVDVSWPKGRNRLVSGRVDLDLAENPDGRTPLRGRLEWSAVDGVQTYERAELRTPTVSAQVSGRIGVDDAAELAIDGETTDLVASDDLFMRVRQALGNAEAHPTGFSGGASFQGLWRGTTSLPIFEGRLDGRDIVYSDIDWGEADWTGLFDTGSESVETRALVLRKGEAEMRWAGRTELGWYGIRDAIEGEVRLSRWPVMDIARFMEWEVDLSGVVSGRAATRGRRSAPEGEARVTVREGRYFDVPFDEAEVEARWGEHRARVTAGLVKLGGGTALFSGTLTEDGIYDGRGEMRDVDLGALASASAGEAAFAGRLSGDAPAGGDPRSSPLERTPDLAAAVPRRRGHRSPGR